MILPRPFLAAVVLEVAGRGCEGGRVGGGELGGGDTVLLTSDPPPSFRLIPDANCLPAVDRACLAFTPAWIMNNS